MKYLTPMLWSFYVLIGFLSFGIVYNSGECGTRKYVSEKLPGTVEYITYESCVDEFSAGIFWPIYWGAIVAIEITEPISPLPKFVEKKLNN